MSEIKLTKEDRAKLNHFNFLIRVEDKCGFGKYTILGQYKNWLTKILVKHNECDNSWEVYPGNLLSGKSNCPFCSGKKQFTTETYKEAISKIDNGEYVLETEYINAYTKVILRHTVCDYLWHVEPQKYKNDGIKCPYCRKRLSAGEKKVSEVLNEHNISYINQHTFPDCKHIALLQFDFGITDESGNIVSVIEFDGIQHFEPIEYFGGEKAFEISKVKDQIKNDYCKENNIPLLRIPYWEEENIEKILKEFLNIID